MEIVEYALIAVTPKGEIISRLLPTSMAITPEEKSRWTERQRVSFGRDLRVFEVVYNREGGSAPTNDDEAAARWEKAYKSSEILTCAEHKGRYSRDRVHLGRACENNSFCGRKTFPGKCITQAAGYTLEDYRDMETTGDVKVCKMCQEKYRALIGDTSD